MISYTMREYALFYVNHNQKSTRQRKLYPQCSGHLARLGFNMQLQTWKKYYQLFTVSILNSFQQLDKVLFFCLMPFVYTENVIHGCNLYFAKTFTTFWIIMNSTITFGEQKSCKKIFFKICSIVLYLLLHIRWSPRLKRNYEFNSFAHFTIWWCLDSRIGLINIVSHFYILLTFLCSVALNV